MKKDLEFWRNFKEVMDSQPSGVDFTTLEFSEEIKTYGGEILKGAPEELFSRKFFYTAAVLGWWANRTKPTESILKQFPNLNNYNANRREIADYLKYTFFNEFQSEINKGNENYIEYALGLKWDMFLPDGTRDIFLF